MWSISGKAARAGGAFFDNETYITNGDAVAVKAVHDKNRCAKRGDPKQQHAEAVGKAAALKGD